jgi:hypothetical protein
MAIRRTQCDLAANGAGAMAPAPPASRCRFPVAGSGKSLPRGPQNVKEQARERRTVSILPRFGGNATFIFYRIYRKRRNTPKWNGENPMRGKNGRGMNGKGMKTG